MDRAKLKASESGAVMPVAYRDNTPIDPHNMFVATIRCALDRGVNWIDTAPVYGEGHSEEVVAEALRTVPKSARPYVFTKCVEIIDLYQMHWPPRDGTPIEDYWQTLLDLKHEGKVRAVGLSNHDVASLERAAELAEIRSAIERSGAGSGLLPA